MFHSKKDNLSSSRLQNHSPRTSNKKHPLWITLPDNMLKHKHLPVLFSFFWDSQQTLNQCSNIVWALISITGFPLHFTWDLRSTGMKDKNCSAILLHFCLIKCTSCTLYGLLISFLSTFQNILYFKCNALWVFDSCVSCKEYWRSHMCCTGIGSEVQLTCHYNISLLHTYNIMK